MSKGSRLALLLLLLQALPAHGQTPVIGLQEVTPTPPNPVGITSAGDGSGRLFVTLQNGRIVIFDGTQILPTPFLDLTSLVIVGSEQGLLGLAFHPSYASNGFFYVNYTANPTGETRIVRYQVSSGDPNLADPASATILLTVPQPFANHNGGQILFGPDGYLYIGLGDGGGGGDPNNNAQDLSKLLGKMLRIDVDGGSPYAIPSTNPFVSTPGARGEIWAYGLRNPWRFTFDRTTGDLFIGDVGQDAREEVDFQPVGSAGGENYGWRLMEGSLCFDPPTGCDPVAMGLTLPILEYAHVVGGDCSIVGGYRYRGAQSPELSGLYLYSDFCSGQIRAGTESGGVWSSNVLLDPFGLFSTFGEDEAGELYVAHYSGASSQISRIRTQTDVSVSLADTPDPVNLGSSVSYTVTVGNNGPSIATSVTLTDTLPPGLAFVSSTPGSPTCAESAGTVSCNLGTLAVSATTNVTIVATPASPGVYSNLAAVASNQIDPVAANDTASESTTVEQAISIDDVTLPEGDSGTTGALFTVSLTAPAAQTVTVAYATADGTASAALGDYVPVSGTLTFDPGVTSQPVTVNVNGDARNEVGETFFVNLSSPTNAIILDGQGLGTITNDDPVPTLSIGDATVTEGDSVAVATFSVSLSAISGRTVLVDYATANGTATGADYVPASGTLAFVEGVTRRTISVRIKGDLLQEPDETLAVDLSNPRDATIADGSGVATILDDDALPAILIRGARVREGQSGTVTAAFQVSLSATSPQTVRVDYATSSGTAAAGLDYAARSGTLTLTPGTTGGTIAVPVIGDTLPERNEVFVVNLRNPVNARLVDRQAQGEIVDDDGSPDPCHPILTLPFTVTSSGQYCLARSLTTSIAAGAAVTVKADAVTLDLRGFTLSGSGSPGSRAFGVYASDRRGLTVRNGVVRGFFEGIVLGASPPYASPQGYVVQSVRAVQNTHAGVWVEGRGNSLTGNTVTGTTGTTVFGPDADAFGIVAAGPAARVIRNVVRETHGVGAGAGIGIAIVSGNGSAASANTIENAALDSSTGILVSTSTGVPARYNRISTMSFGIVYSPDATGTYSGNILVGVVTPYVGGTNGGP